MSVLQFNNAVVQCNFFFSRPRTVAVKVKLFFLWHRNIGITFKCCHSICWVLVVYSSQILSVSRLWFVFYRSWISVFFRDVHHAGMFNFFANVNSQSANQTKVAHSLWACRCRKGDLFKFKEWRWKGIEVTWLWTWWPWMLVADDLRGFQQHHNHLLVLQWTVTKREVSEWQFCGGQCLFDVRGQGSECSDWLETIEKQW